LGHENTPSLDFQYQELSILVVAQGNLNEHYLDE